MSGTLLATGYDTTLGKAIAECAKASSYTVAATVEPGFSKSEENDIPVVAEWNRKVLLSAQNVLLSTANTLGSVNEVVIIFDLSTSAPESIVPIHELTSLALDSEMDRSLRSNIYLLKETLNFFAGRQGNENLGITFVMNGAGIEVLSPLQSLVAGAFMRLTQSCFGMYQNEPYVLKGFHTGSDDAAGFARFIVDALVGGARDGRWYRFSGDGFPELRFPRK